MGPGIELIGKRVTIRLHDPEGGYRDIVGTLNSLTTLTRRDGTIATFDPATVAYWREIQSKTHIVGQGAPLSLRIREMEIAANATWRAKEEVALGGWLLRASGKFTLRANSVLPLGEPPYGNPGIEIEKAINEVVEFYLSRKLTPVFHIPLPTYRELDFLLESRGWQLKSNVHVMVADIAPKEITEVKSEEWSVSIKPSAQWLALQHDEPLLELMSSSPAAYIQCCVNGHVVAVARCGRSEDWAVLSRLYVDPELRGKGLGYRALALLLNEAAKEGATKALLQVDSGNTTAISMYEKLGFTYHHTYLYRTFLGA